MNELPEIGERVREELEQLAAEIAAVGPLFEKLSQRAPDDVEMRAAALSLHGFYNGVERIFLLIAKYLDRHVPGGVRWHRQLLDQMKVSAENRPEIIDQEVYDMLVEYLSFRHIVRHSYPGTLSWDRFREIAYDLTKIHGRVDDCVRRFLAGMRKQKGERQAE